MIINFNFPAPKSYFLWSNKSRKKFHGVELGKKSNLGNVTFAAQIIPAKKYFFMVGVKL